ncbi:MAG TPA: ABC transporter substrate-binding protein [Rhodanobacter sp.]|nr:ABC transporter substrate-binding protein [Rhodanobacter sp.]
MEAQTRTTVAGALTAAVLLGSGGMPVTSAHAQDRLVVAGYGGSSEAIFRAQILAPFAAQHHLQIDYVAGPSASNLARLQAERHQPAIDLAVLDDGPMQQAVTLGLCQPTAPAPVMHDLYDIATRYGDGKAVGIGVVATGLAYNTAAFAQHRWPAPTSWTDLANPTYRGHVLVPSIINTYGLQTLLALARQGGGGAQNIEPGFAFLSGRVAPNVLTFETSSGKISELLQTGEVVLGVWGNGRTEALARTGFPVAFVTPREGAQALITSACVVAGSQHVALAQALLQELLSPRVQAVLAARAGWGPVNRTVRLDPAVARTVVYGDAAMAALVPVDWETVNPARVAWTQRWMREVER